jgi:hypothetical protein
MLNLDSIYLITASLNKYLARNSIQESDLKLISLKLEALLREIPLPTYQMIPAQLERMSINERIPPFKNERFNEIDLLIYPPINAVKKYGRCNVTEDSVLYGSFNLITVVEEMRPEIGQAITHSYWKVKDDYSLKWFPVFFITETTNKANVHNPLSLDIKRLHEEYCSHLSERDKSAFNLSMEFLAKCFAKDVDPYNHTDYFLSAYISKRIFDNKGLAYDGILYPSVKGRLGSSNMAVRPTSFDDHFYIEEVRHEINIVPPGHNGINYVSSYSRSFDLEKKIIIWDK